MEKIYKKNLELISKMFSYQMSNSSDVENVWQTLSDAVEFNEAYAFLINPENINLKCSFNPQKHLQNEEYIDIDEDLSQKLFYKESIILNKNSKLIKTLKLKNIKSGLFVKLTFRETVFGFVLFVRRENDFSIEDLEMITPFVVVLSYLIKDLELSNVFNIQLNALKNAMLEVNNAYKTIKEQNIKILEADKVKNEFLANISHELRTPLNAIIGFSEILSTKTYGDLNNQQEEYVKDIQASGIHLLGMINEILDISKIEAKAMKIIKRPFAVELALTEVCNIVQPLAQKKQIVVEKNINTDIDFYGDYQKIQQILYNLLSNAIKFTYEKGKIILEASSTDKDLILKVKDNGIGIDKKYHKKIFDKFVQLEDAYTKTTSSTGLGLAITKEFVEMHNGKIIIDSEPNKGTTFTIKLPRVAE